MKAKPYTIRYIEHIDNGPQRMAVQGKRNKTVTIAKKLLQWFFGRNDSWPFPHLYVTVFDSQIISVGDDNAFALYQLDMFHIAIAGQKPKEVSQREWEESVLPHNIFHELHHFIQDSNGLLLGNDTDEEEANEFAESMVKKWNDFMSMQ